MALTLACGSTADDGDGGASTAATTVETTGTTQPGTTAMPTTDTTVGDDEWGGGFDDGLHVADIPTSCDVFAQDCPAGNKCVAWASEGGGNVIDATRCLPIPREADAAGEICMVLGEPGDGLDTCALGSMCRNIDTETLQGVCLPFCEGTLERHTCSAPEVCVEGGDGLLATCVYPCDPFAQDCPGGQLCWLVFLNAFGCTTGGPGLPGDACTSVYECAPGNICVDANEVPGCAAAECCTALCDLLDPMPSCLPGQTCEPTREPAPPGYENLGSCRLP